MHHNAGQRQASMQLDSEVQKLYHEVEQLRLKDLQQEHHIHMLTQQLRFSQSQPDQAETKVLSVLLPRRSAYLLVPNTVTSKQFSHFQACHQQGCSSKCWCNYTLLHNVYHCIVQHCVSSRAQQMSNFACRQRPSHQYCPPL